MSGGFAVFAKRPHRTEPGEFEYECVGSVKQIAAQCENHQCYCEGTFG